MKLIVQKNVKYTLKEFFSEIINYDYLDGIALNIVKTKDNVLVVINLSSQSSTFVKTISSNEVVNLKGFEMIPLLEIMTYLDKIGYKKKVILNIIPYQPIRLTEDENKLLVEEYKQYAKNLKEMTENSNLDIYIHSISRTLVNFLKHENIKAKLGFAFGGFDLNYIDVDYYLFTVDMLNFPLMKQQLDNNKEVIIYIGTEYELSYVYDISRGNKMTKLTDEVFKNTYLMGDYPEILKATFL